MDPIQPSTGSDFQGLLNAKDPTTWFLEWTINFDWSTWLENLFRRKGVDTMAMTHEDWIPIIKEFLPVVFEMFKELLGLLKKLPEPQQTQTIAWVAEKVTGVKRA